MLKVACLIVFVFAVWQANSQNNFNLDMGFWNANQGEQVRVYAGLGHEWRLLPFLGIELNATAGKARKNTDGFQVISGDYYGNNTDIHFSYQTLCPKINGYLNLKYNEYDVPVGYLYAGLGIGLSAVTSKGTLRISNGEEFAGEAKVFPRIYSDFEVGYGAEVGEDVHMKLSVRVENIPFEKAIVEMNGQRSADFPADFATNMSKGSIQLTITYFYKKNKSKK